MSADIVRAACHEIERAMQAQLDEVSERTGMMIESVRVDLYQSHTVAQSRSRAIPVVEIELRAVRR